MWKLKFLSYMNYMKIFVCRQVLNLWRVFKKLQCCFSAPDLCTMPDHQIKCSIFIYFSWFLFASNYYKIAKISCQVTIINLLWLLMLVLYGKYCFLWFFKKEVRGNFKNTSLTCIKLCACNCTGSLFWECFFTGILW